MGEEMSKPVTLQYVSKEMFCKPTNRQKIQNLMKHLKEVKLASSFNYVNYFKSIKSTHLTGTCC